ncbi:transcriptional regulator, GntR family [Rhizobiales bacterium GAS191]|nr:transcriptional regulator, GntR family [Rhizobiales bacterium GAS188]SEE91381.1 transcriptional regulator, GntR family [Rhizobiales bacterium GAS191]
MSRHIEIRQLIIADLVSGAFPPGARLKIDELASRYATGHMPVREALRELQGAGILQVGPGRSARVAQMDRRFVENLFATRSALEIMLTQRAASRCRRDDIDGLQAIEEALEAQVQSGDYRGAFNSNREFHTRIYALADNPEAVALVERNWTLLLALWERVGFAADRYGGVVSDHRSLLKALAANDAEAAGMIMGAHVVKAKFELLERVDRQRNSSP